MATKEEMREYIQWHIEDLEDELEDAWVTVQHLEKLIREAKSGLMGFRIVENDEK